MSNQRTDSSGKVFQYYSELHQAAEDNEVTRIKKLLENGADVNGRDEIDSTPLHEVAFLNGNFGTDYFDAAEVLLKNGANINARDLEGQTPLFNLVRKGNVKIVQLFLKYKADINVVDHQGRTALFLAAVYNKDVEIVKLLVDLGLDDKTRCKYGNTPLNQACKILCDNIKFVKFFVKNGANVNEANKRGITPLVDALMFATYYLEVMGENRDAVEKKIKFLLDNANLNSYHDFDKIGVAEYKEGSKFLWNIILKHIAKLQLVKVPVHSVILETILQEGYCNYYYKLCQEELLRAKSTKVENCWLTFFNLLVDDRRKLKNYGGNRDLIKGLKKNYCIKKFPIYGALMEENLKKGINRRKLFDKSSIILSYCLPIFNPNHLIVGNILDCILSKKDLSKLCK